MGRQEFPPLASATHHSSPITHHFDGKERDMVQVGERAPEWTLPTLAGGELGLRNLRGRKALLFFWASW